MSKTIYWHDYETFGKDPRLDRPCQFAGIRTDEELNIIDDPMVIYCRTAPDFLPDPEACLITGIRPQDALQDGLPEAEFCARIFQEFIRPGTCGAGYNSVRFDDEVTRHLLYRNFYDPYEREWKSGNSRWDIIDMIRLAYAVRPQGIHWPSRADGSPSFRLEDLTRENAISHDDAHDARSDVLATIDIARLVKRQQPQLYDYLYERRYKSRIQPMLDLKKPEPLVHISAMYAAEKGCLAVVLPLARHPLNQNGVIVYDLSVDPSEWLGLTVEEIRERLFTPRNEMQEGVERIALKTVHANKCPVLAPLSILTGDVVDRWQMDLESCRRNRQTLEAADGLEQKIEAAFSREGDFADDENDPDRMLYSGGFFDDGDRVKMNEIRSLLPEQLAGFQEKFRDGRLPEMLFRYRARNFPHTLSADETRQWQAYCRSALLDNGGAGIGWQAFWDSLPQLRQEYAVQTELLDRLEEYAAGLGQALSLPGPMEASATGQSSS